jgi:hypothetical protein
MVTGSVCVCTLMSLCCFLHFENVYLKEGYEQPFKEGEVLAGPGWSTVCLQYGCCKTLASVALRYLWQGRLTSKSNLGGRCQ